MRSARLLASALLLAWAVQAPAHAHSGLRFSSPLDGATLGDSPTHVQLTFLERPEPSLSTIRVIDAAGAAWHEGRPEPLANDPLSLAVRVRTLGRGVYTVHWRVVSAVDGHASAGVFAFGVLVSPAGVTAPAGSAETASAMNALARSLLMAGLAAMFGAAAAHLGRFGMGRALHVAAGGWVASIVGLVLLALAQQRIAEVGFVELSGTAIGRALIWRAAAIAASVAALALAARAAAGGRSTLADVGVLVLGLATLWTLAVHSAAGHAGAGRWPIAAMVLFHTIHVAAVGVWLGGLASLLAGLRGSASEAKAAAIRRFSRLAAVGLLIVVATGVVRTVVEMSSWNDFLATTYGRVLSIKVALALGLAVLGAINRWRSVPQAAVSLRGLRRIGGGELALAAAALVAAAWLAELAPPAASQSIAGITASGADFGTTVRVRLTAASDHPGPNRFLVFVDDYDSREPVRADRVSLRFTPIDDLGVPTTALPLHPNALGNTRWGPRLLAAGPDSSYVGSGANLGFDGRWRIGVLVERAGTSTEVPLEVETRSLPQPVSIARIPGQAPQYTVLVPRVGLVRFSPSPERPGPSELTVSCFDLLSERWAMEQMVITTSAGGGVPRQQTVRRVDPSRFAATIELRPGRNHLVAIARAADGTRLRAAVEIDVPSR